MDFETPPRITVVIPVLNGDSTLDDAINSARAQTHQNLEIFVIDDGSTDNSKKIVYRHEKADDRVRLLANSCTSGVAHSRNLGISNSTGDFIAPLDCDDIWHPKKLELQLKKYHEHMKSDRNVPLVVYCWCLRMEPDGTAIPTYYRPKFKNNVFRIFVERNFMPTASIPLMPRSLVSEVGGYSPRLFESGIQGCEDRDLYLSLAKSAHFVCVEKALVGQRVMPDSMSRNSERMFNSLARVLNDQIVPDTGSRLVNRTLGATLMRWSILRKKNRWNRFKEALRYDRFAPIYPPTWVALAGAIYRGGRRKLCHFCESQSNLIEQWLPRNLTLSENVSSHDKGVSDR